MNIEDPHGVSNILPALTQDQKDAEMYEFRILVYSFMVQMYGMQLSAFAAVPASQRNNTLMGVLQHQMNVCQQNAVRANRRYEYLQNKIKLGKLS